MKRTTGWLLSAGALALGASGCIVAAPDGDDGLGSAENPLAAWEADDPSEQPERADLLPPRRHVDLDEPVGITANATDEGSEGAEDDPSNPDPTPWQGTAASAAGGDGNPDPTPWNTAGGEEEEDEGGTDEGNEGEPDPQPWMNDWSFDTDDGD